MDLVMHSKLNGFLSWIINVCADTLVEYDKDLSFDNFKCFDLLLYRKGINIDIRNKNGTTLVATLTIRKKYAYLDHLKSQI